MLLFHVSETLLTVSCETRCFLCSHNLRPDTVNYVHLQAKFQTLDLDLFLTYALQISGRWVCDLVLSLSGCGLRYWTKVQSTRSHDIGQLESARSCNRKQEDCLQGSRAHGSLGSCVFFAMVRMCAYTYMNMCICTCMYAHRERERERERLVRAWTSKNNGLVDIPPAQLRALAQDYFFIINNVIVACFVLDIALLCHANVQCKNPEGPVTMPHRKFVFEP